MQYKKSRLALVAVVIFSMMMAYSFVPAQAASLEAAKDTLSDSDISAVATHVFNFDMGTALTAGQYVEISFDNGFTGVASGNATCPANTTAGGAGQLITCTVDVGQTLASTSAQTITVTGVTNPGAAGDRTLYVRTKNVANAEIESSQIKVYIIDDVVVSARVDASLTFAISGINAGVSVNGVTTTATSTATAMNFGTLPVGAPRAIAQELRVSTNAADGYVVTVKQDGDMVSAANSTINAFDNGVVPGIPTGWSSPDGTLGNEDTYGHMGFTTDDSTITGGDPYGLAQFGGLNGTAAAEVMRHTGPSDNSTPGIGLANVAYQVEITGLQEAGDYQNTLTYIATPTY